MNKRLPLLMFNCNRSVLSGICLKNHWILKGEKWKIILMGMYRLGMSLFSVAEVSFEPSFRICTLRAVSFGVGFSMVIAYLGLVISAEEKIQIENEYYIRYTSEDSIRYTSEH